MNPQQKKIINHARRMVAQQFEAILSDVSGSEKQELAQLSKNIDFCFLSLEQDISTLRFLHMILPQQLKKAKETYRIELKMPDNFSDMMKLKR